MLEKIVPLAVVDVFEKEDKLLDYLEEEGGKPDLIFLGLEGKQDAAFMIARRVRQDGNMVPIIIIADTQDLMPQAFEIFAFNYLCRPVSQESLMKVMGPLVNYWESQVRKYVHFKVRSHSERLFLDEIAYISSSLHTINFHLADRSVIKCRGKLSDLNAQLEGSLIVRCHQSFFINLSKIETMRNESCVIMGESIPISRAHSKAVHKLYKNLYE